ncbi:TetR/AcrR family transcriptional regulator [Paraburkholderia sp. CNPSo 3274]|uniref:TetR/AcrR family transcriptional regulator n=1 Tax=Paraburkholderia sp. CNPSo 3274 TaxID=2940932 RepID=UPI0020B8C144|nr:TetR/AcrR family transcriptional regulator [Paraburkholderia sp. CNPSo 3274]MCP3708811.1 TetR/AcrR family transcriptional regulator [Paraburkholderia sp. CNPSo 3274]
MKDSSVKAPARAARRSAKAADAAAPSAPPAPSTSKHPSPRKDAAPAVGTRRKKAPAQVRAQLLQAASDIATDQGVPAVTLDAVAERAGVTKGALQYHFANKQGLLDALFEQTLARFEQQMHTRIDEGVAEGAPKHSAAARAYLHTTIDEASPAASTNVLRVLVAAMMTDPAIRERYAAPMRKWTRPDPLALEAAARLMICRLAADGLWISDLLGYQNMPPRLRAEVVRQLEQLALVKD